MVIPLLCAMVTFGAQGAFLLCGVVTCEAGGARNELLYSLSASHGGNFSTFTILFSSLLYSVPASYVFLFFVLVSFYSVSVSVSLSSSESPSSSIALCQLKIEHAYQ